MTSGPSELNDLLAGFLARPRVPTPDEATGQIFDLEGWKLFALTGLWADEPNMGGDLMLQSPGGKSLHANWGVVLGPMNTVEFSGDPHVPLEFHLNKPVVDWAELASAIASLVPAIANRYSEAAPSNTSLERTRDR